MEPIFQYAARVHRWIDGDSVILDIDCGFSVYLAKQSVRLMGIDTSETRGGTPELKWLGNLAKQYVSVRVREGKNRRRITANSTP